MSVENHKPAVEPPTDGREAVLTARMPKQTSDRVFHKPHDEREGVPQCTPTEERNFWSFSLATVRRRFGDVRPCRVCYDRDYDTRFDDSTCPFCGETVKGNQLPKHISADCEATP